MATTSLLSNIASVRIELTYKSGERVVLDAASGGQIIGCDCSFVPSRIEVKPQNETHKYRPGPFTVLNLHVVARHADAEVGLSPPGPEHLVPGALPEPTAPEAAAKE